MMAPLMLTAWLCIASSACALSLAAHPPPDDSACLIAAYPEHVCGFAAGYLLGCDGALIRWEDGQETREYEKMLDRADLSDQMATRYWLGDFKRRPELNEDPGRARSEALFKMMYGASAEAVRATLEQVEWLPERGGRTLRFTGVNGAAEALRRVSEELHALGPALEEAIVKDSGTFVWREIKGTERRLSMHSFAIAVDVGVSISDYWRWSEPDREGRYLYKNRMPAHVVEVFERHGFIWGGKWYHYDTMHFEYRPELIACATPRPTDDPDR